MSNPKSNLVNQAGFGILSVVVAMGLASIMMMMIADMINYSGSAQRAVQIKTERAAFIGNLTNILLVDPTCTNSLKGSDVTKPLIMNDPTNASKAVAKAGMRFQDWEISSLELTNQHLVDSAMNLYSGDVIITLKHPRRELGLTPITTKQMATVYYTADAGTITRCFGVSNQALASKSYCTSMGGAWSDSAIQCTLPSVASNSPLASDSVGSSASATTNSPLTVSEVVASATNGKNTAVVNTPASKVVTGVDHSVGKPRN